MQKVRWEGLVGASKYWALYALQILPLLPTSGATSSLLAEAESLGEALGNLFVVSTGQCIFGCGCGARGQPWVLFLRSRLLLCSEPVSH